MTTRPSSFRVVRSRSPVFGRPAPVESVGARAWRPGRARSRERWTRRTSRAPIPAIGEGSAEESTEAPVPGNRTLRDCRRDAAGDPARPERRRATTEHEHVWRRAGGSGSLRRAHGRLRARGCGEPVGARGASRVDRRRAARARRDGLFAWGPPDARRRARLRRKTPSRARRLDAARRAFPVDARWCERRE